MAALLFFRSLPRPGGCRRVLHSLLGPPLRLGGAQVAAKELAEHGHGVVRLAHLLLHLLLLLLEFLHRVPA